MVTDRDEGAPAKPAQRAADDEMLNDQMRAASVPAGEMKATGATRGDMTAEGTIQWLPIGH